jgi:hypothetical protein
LGPSTLLLVGVLYACHRYGLPTWTLPFVGILLALPLSMVRDRQFGIPGVTSLPIGVFVKFSILGAMIIGVFGCLAFAGKWLLGLGAPTPREILVLFAAVLMLVAS